MAKNSMDYDVDFLRKALRVLVEGIMDAEVSAQIGTERGERNPERITYRNGYRSRDWDTRVGTMELRIPKIRKEIPSSHRRGGHLPQPRAATRRLVGAVLAGRHDEWAEGRRYLTFTEGLATETLPASNILEAAAGRNLFRSSSLNLPLWLSDGNHSRRAAAIPTCTGCSWNGQRN